MVICAILKVSIPVLYGQPVGKTPTIAGKKKEEKVTYEQRSIQCISLQVLQ